ncbi:MAG: serine/threonine protein kinase [Deltaproteobacteria bacterium]|nr:serine/threonine protein kinase [Deltaproteobacteria bacterium]
MAEVFLAERRGPGGFVKRFAIKIVKAVDDDDEEESTKRFEAEARLSGILEHPNIVRVYDFAQYPRPYLVMEHVEGVSLLQMLRKLLSVKDRFPFDLAAFVVARVARGLEHAHVQFGPDAEPLGLIHRDVSAANILLSYQGEVKISDFGIAQSTNNPWKTLTGTVLGKTSYMSPEQARGEPIDARSDIFSTGVVLWELLAMRPLYPQSDQDAQKRRAAKVRPPAVIEVLPSVPPELSEIAARALEPLVEDRTPTAGELADELDEYLSHLRAPPRERALGSLLEKYFPRKAQMGEEEATIVETALPDAVRERIEQEISKRRKDETPTAAENRVYSVQGPDHGPPVGDDEEGSEMEPEQDGGEGAAPTLMMEGASRASARGSRDAPIVPVGTEPETLLGLGALPEGAGPRRAPAEVSRPHGRRISHDASTVTMPVYKERPVALLVIAAVVLLLGGAIAALWVFRDAPWNPLGSAGQMPGSLEVWQLRSSPEGFRIFVDERYVGATPLDVEWSQVPAGASVVALKEGFPPLVALGRSLDGYRLGLVRFPGAVAPYPEGTGSEGVTVALRRRDGRVVGYSVVTFPAGMPSPSQERIREEGHDLVYRYSACRPWVPCVASAGGD